MTRRGLGQVIGVGSYLKGKLININTSYRNFCNIDGSPAFLVLGVRKVIPPNVIEIERKNSEQHVF